MKVYKFGGASVKNAEGVRNVEKIVRLAGALDLMVVVSAMGKTTNALERVVEFLDAGKEEQALTQWIDIVDFHVAIMKELGLQPGSDIRLQGEIPYDPAQSLDENYDQMLLGASIAGSAMMQSGTTLPHGLGYPLSQYHHVNHGLSCSITLGEYMRAFKDQTLPQKVMAMCGFTDTQDMCDFFQEIIKRDLHIKVTRAEIDQWTDFFWETEQNNRLKRNPEPISKEQIHEMYLKSLAPYIVD